MLCFSIVKPLYGISPRTVFGNKAWQITRQHCYKKSGDRCQACGIHKSQAPFKKQVEAHEYYEIFWDDGCVTLREIVSLCPECHGVIHHRRRASMVKDGSMSKWYSDYVDNHGKRILTAAGLPLRIDPPENKIPWGEWYFLDEFGNRHYSQFCDERHCDLHYEQLNKKILARKKSA